MNSNLPKAINYVSECLIDCLKNDNKILICGNGSTADSQHFAPKLLELFYKVTIEHNIDFSNSYAIGDNIRNLDICKKESVKGTLLGKSDINNEF